MDYDGANQHQITHSEFDLAHAAMVARRDAHRLHLLRSFPRRHVRANLHLFDGLESPDCVPALSRDEQLAGVVA